MEKKKVVQFREIEVEIEAVNIINIISDLQTQITDEEDIIFENFNFIKRSLFCYLQYYIRYNNDFACIVK